MESTATIGQLTFEKSGPLTLVQDLGRSGGQQLGFAPSGAADQHAFQWANQLLKNPENTPVFEITLGPVALTFSAPTRIALTGANAEVTLDDRPVYPWSSARVTAGARLIIKPPKAGLRTYLSIAGGFQTPTLFNSASCVPKEPIPTPMNRAIITGDTFYYKPLSEEALSVRNLMAPFQAQPDHTQLLTLKVRPCYQFSKFSEEAIKTLTTETYSVSQLCDRMGYRLSGAPITFPGNLEWSEGIALGSIQIPPNGQPIVLLRDRQTIGGYPKIGTVTAEGCDALSQRRPGQLVKFSLLEK